MPDGECLMNDAFLRTVKGSPLFRDRLFRSYLFSETILFAILNTFAFGVSVSYLAFTDHASKHKHVEGFTNRTKYSSGVRFSSVYDIVYPIPSTSSVPSSRYATKAGHPETATGESFRPLLPVVRTRLRMASAGRSLTDPAAVS